ncbi:MAG: chorismate synthase, partial [Oscillospiraceae bacterium]|nr:chorismate synthase [Oscillospiraceae bacterium]
RKELDDFEILSGFFNNKTTGSPLCVIFKNKNINSEFFEKNFNKPRPSTADLTLAIRYNFNNDYRSAGHSSARLTVGLVFAGNICYQILKQKFNITVGSHIISLYKKTSESLDKSNISRSLLHRLSLEYFPVIKDNDKQIYINIIKKLKNNGNTAGGKIETAILGLPIGIGSPIFDNLESKIASLLFSIPAVKSVDFGLGIDKLDGFSANDEFFFDNNLNIKTRTNNHCGILGGISSGEPIIFQVGFKPIASISKTQNTIDLNTKKNTSIKINTNNDISPVIRAAPIVEAAVSIAILDLFYNKY